MLNPTNIDYPLASTLVLEEAPWNDGVTLPVSCPACGNTYIHTMPPEYEKGNDNYDASWQGRGDLIVIPVWGECGHNWEICFGFHKGQTFSFVRPREHQPDTMERIVERDYTACRPL